MILNQDTKAPIPPRPKSAAGAVIGRWLVILLFAGVVGLNVWQYRERLRLDFEKGELRDELAASNEMATQHAERILRLKQTHDKMRVEYEELFDLYERRDQARKIAAASQQYEAPRHVATTRAPVAPPPTARPSAPVRRPSVQAYTPPPVQTVSADKIHDALRPKVDRFYKAKRHNGSGSTLVFEVEAEYGEPREVPGWSGRYEVKGEVFFQYYDSIWGGSFSRGTGTFTAQVRAEGGRIEVLELDAR